MSQLLGPMKQSDHRKVAGVEIDIVKVGSGRVGRPTSAGAVAPPPGVVMAGAASLTVPSQAVGRGTMPWL